MKNINNILKIVGFFMLVAFIASCNQEAFEEYSSVPAAGAPTITVTIDNNTDSAMTVTYSMNMPGRVTLAVIPASVDTPSMADLLGRAIDGAVDIDYFISEETTPEGTVTYEGLEPYTQYRVLGIGNNNDGVASDMVITDLIRTQDYVDPVLSSYSPAGQDPRVLSNQPIVLTFSEPVVYDNTKDITFSTYFGGLNETIPEDSISVSGNVVTISYGILPYNDYCFISYPEGAFTDQSGNVCAAENSGVIGGYLEGIWFRVETDPATQLAVIFDNFITDYTCTDYVQADSATVDWGPYSITVSEDPDVEYGVIISNFWAWGVDAKFQFNEDGTITCPEQMLDGVDMGDIYGSAYSGYSIWVRGWAPDIYTKAVGHWDYTDFSFDIALSFYNDVYGQIYGDIYQSYELPTAKTATKGQKSQMNLSF